MVSSTGVVADATRIAEETLFPAALATDRSQLVGVELLDQLAAAGFYGLVGPAGAGGLEADLEPLCLGTRRAGVAFAGLRRPGPPILVARRAPGGWVLDGTAPWVTGWGRIDVIHVAARDGDQVVWALVDAAEGPSLGIEVLPLAAVAASGTVTVRFRGHAVPDERVTLEELPLPSGSRGQ